jgi:hypothetical protein
MMHSQKVVTPAKAGVQKYLFFLDSSQRTTLVRFRRNNKKERFLTFYETNKDAYHDSEEQETIDQKEHLKAVLF